MRNIGIIGLGKMGILHSGIMNVQQNAQVKAICEKDPLLNRIARSLFPKTINLYNNHLEMIKREGLDAVFITTPIATHARLIVDLAKADPSISLFVEKPLASSGEEAHTACEAVKALQGVHMVGFQKRFSPIFRQAKALLEKRAIGELMFFRAYHFSSDVLRDAHSWRMQRGTGGVLLDLAPHLLDLLLWLFGNPVEIASARQRIYSSKVDDFVHVAMTFESGLKGHADVSWSIRSFRLPEISMEIYGKNGILSVTDDWLKIRRDAANSTGMDVTETQYKTSLDTAVSFLLAEPEYALEDEAFLRAIEDRNLPATNFFEAARVNELIERILNDA